MRTAKLYLIAVFLLPFSTALNNAEPAESLETPLLTDITIDAAQECFRLASSVPEFRIEEQPKGIEDEESYGGGEQVPETLTDAEAKAEAEAEAEAEEPCALAIQNNNQTPRDLAASYSNQGLILASKGDYTLAILSHTQAVALMEEAEESESIYINRGNAYFAIQDYPAANADYSRAIVLSAGTNHRALYNRALVFKALGYIHRALKELEHALLLAPDNPRYLASHNLLQQAAATPEIGEQEAYDPER